MVNMYEHKIYVPTVYALIIDQLRTGMAEAHGGCSRILVHGSWKSDDLDICSEPVAMYSCITSYRTRPDAMSVAANALLAAGEECVLYTCQEVHAEFINE